MVITQAQFNKAMEEINSSYSKLVKRLEQVESQLKEAKAPSKSTGAK